MFTFSNYESRTSLDRPGFGESFLHSEGLPAIHFVSGANHWWQTTEMVPALRSARRFARRVSHVRRASYGSSMGGFGALQTAADLDVDAVFAVSPQFSVHAEYVPFETRWRKEAATLERIAPAIGPIPDDVRVVVAFDPAHAHDAAHVSLIPTKIEAVALPYSGHPSTKVLAQTSHLKPLVRLLCDGEWISADVAELARNARRARPLSPAYLDNLARHCLKRGKRSLARVCAERAVERAPRNPNLRVFLGDLFRQEGRRAVAMRHYAEALDHARAEMERRPDSSKEHWRLRGILERLGDMEGALRHAEIACQLSPEPTWNEHVRTLRRRRRARGHGR